MFRIQTTITTTWQEFDETFEDNPIQRDTQRRAESSRHLDVLEATHLSFFGAQTRAGRLYKLDGHTRILRWHRDAELAPKQSVHVTVYDVEDEAEVERLYTHFDSEKSTERSRDRIEGAWRKMGFQPQSSYLIRGKLKSAMQKAAQVAGIGKDRNSEYELVEMFCPQLRLLDSLHPSRQWFNVGITAAFLVTVRTDGLKALDFWGKYASTGGNKTASQIDPVEALRDLVRRSGKALQSSIEQDAILYKAISAYASTKPYRLNGNGIATIKSTSDVSRFKSRRPAVAAGLRKVAG